MLPPLASLRSAVPPKFALRANGGDGPLRV